MIWLGIIGFFLVAGVIAFIAWMDSENAFYLMIGGICMMVMFGSLYLIVEDINPTPTTLDVYRGKTTLEITYRDSVAVDSTVVFKVR